MWTRRAPNSAASHCRPMRLPSNEGPRRGGGRLPGRGGGRLPGPQRHCEPAHPPESPLPTRLGSRPSWRRGGAGGSQPASRCRGCPRPTLAGSRRPSAGSRPEAPPPPELGVVFVSRETNKRQTETNSTTGPADSWRGKVPRGGGISDFGISDSQPALPNPSRARSPALLVCAHAYGSDLLKKPGHYGQLVRTGHG